MRTLLHIRQKGLFGGEVVVHPVKLARAGGARGVADAEAEELGELSLAAQAAVRER